jgi:hypothetical protein
VVVQVDLEVLALLAGEETHEERDAGALPDLDEAGRAVGVARS